MVGYAFYVNSSVRNQVKLFLVEAIAMIQFHLSNIRQWMGVLREQNSIFRAFINNVEKKQDKY